MNTNIDNTQLDAQVLSDDAADIDTAKQERACPNCGQAFVPRARSGGKPQRFCKPECKDAFHANGQRGQRSPTCDAQSALAAVVQPTTRKTAPPATPEDESDDWSEPILTEQFATGAYFNTEGELVICQRRWPDENQYVFIGPDSINTFLDKLCDVCGIPSAGK